MPANTTPTTPMPTTTAQTGMPPAAGHTRSDHTSAAAKTTSAGVRRSGSRPRYGVDRDRATQGGDAIVQAANSPEATCRVDAATVVGDGELDALIVGPHGDRDRRVR